MAGDAWYYTRGGQQTGPVSGSTLGQMAAAGTLEPQDLIWREGMADWAPASTIPGLFPTAAAAATPQVTPLGYAGPVPVNYYSPIHRPVLFAGFWMRFAAAFIDGLVIAAAGAVMGFVVGFLIGYSMGRSGSTAAEIESTVSLVANILSIAIQWLYEALMESSAKQATLGKMALGIKVTNMQGARISFGQATGRYFGKFISALILLVGYIMAAFTERKQALHDIMAGTLVVRK